VFVVAALAASCTLGQNYKRPAIETPSTYRSAAGQPSTASLADLQWFELFHDETLTGLVKTALQENFELRIAAERILQARAAYGITRAAQFPSVDVSADAIAARSSQRGANRGIPAGVDTDVSYAQVGFSLGWELDVWGRLRRLSEAGRAQYLATEEAKRGVVTTLVADVSETYLALRALDLELEIAKRTRDVANDSLRLTETCPETFRAADRWKPCRHLQRFRRVCLPHFLSAGPISAGQSRNSWRQMRRSAP
jgi:multidrug efflux system outer membrane protein